jgi:hypothetical protein
MDPDLTYRDLRQDKKIENLFNIIRSVGQSTHYLQQACISNLLVTVFAYFLQTQGPRPLF